MHETLLIQRLNDDHLKLGRQLIDLFNEVFEEATSNNPDLGTWLRRRDLIALAAFDEGHMVGGLTAYILPMFRQQKREAFIYDLAVKSTHQRQGIGTKLMGALEDHCRSANIAYAFVPAEVEDQHAVDFYRKLGWQETTVAHFGKAIHR